MIYNTQKLTLHVYSNTHESIEHGVYIKKKSYSLPLKHFNYISIITNYTFIKLKRENSQSHLNIKQ